VGGLISASTRPGSAAVADDDVGGGTATGGTERLGRTADIACSLKRTSRLHV